MKKSLYENKVTDYFKKFKDFEIKSAQDKVNIGITLYEPKCKIKGIFQISHGMMEHRKRYIEFMNYLGGNGYICVVHDHIGHGDSVKCKEDYGYFYDNGAVNLVEDLHQITLYMKQKYKNYPYFIFGFSMGSLIARAYLKKYDYELDGLILCGSPIEIKCIPFVEKLCKIIEKIKGDHYRSVFIHKIVRGIDNNRLTNSKDELNEFMNDDGCGFIFTINGFENLCVLIHNVYNEKGWIKSNLSLPIFSIAGEDDLIIINRKKFNKLTSFMKRIGYKKIDSKIYLKKYHDLLHEENKLEVYKDILNWINKISINSFNK
jgi:alpha-beta hydrolase superfamily lysophospholipase